MRIEEPLGNLKEVTTGESGALEAAGSQVAPEKPSPGVLGAVEGEVRLVLDHLARWRALHERELARFQALELSIGSELLNLPPEAPPHCEGVWQFRERLNERLLALEAARRQLTVNHEDRVQALHDRLFQALQRRGHLVPRRYGH